MDLEKGEYQTERFNRLLCLFMSPGPLTWLGENPTYHTIVPFLISHFSFFLDGFSDPTLALSSITTAIDELPTLLPLLLSSAGIMGQQAWTTRPGLSRFRCWRQAFVHVRKTLYQPYVNPNERFRGFSMKLIIYGLLADMTLKFKIWAGERTQKLRDWAACPSRGPEFKSRHPYINSWQSIIQSQGSDIFFWPLRALHTK